MTPDEEEDYRRLHADYKRVATEVLAWRSEISEALGMTTWSEQGYTATLAEAVARIKELKEQILQNYDRIQDLVARDRGGYE